MLQTWSKNGFICTQKLLKQFTCVLPLPSSMLTVGMRHAARTGKISIGDVLVAVCPLSSPAAEEVCIAPEHQKQRRCIKWVNVVGWGSHDAAALVVGAPETRVWLRMKTADSGTKTPCPCSTQCMWCHASVAPETKNRLHTEKKDSRTRKSLSCGNSCVWYSAGGAPQTRMWLRMRQADSCESVSLW